MRKPKREKYSSKEALKRLSIAYEKQNKGKLLLCAVAALTVTALFLVFSLALGKINTDTVRKIREGGNSISTRLIQGTEENEKRLRELSYIKAIGYEKQAGGLYKGGSKYANCLIVDEGTFAEMVMPAYTGIHGTYPQKSNEIMLSENMLRNLGIEDPVIGMKLSLEFYWDDLMLDTDNVSQEFILSGYFQEYCTKQSDKMKAYISCKMLEESGGTLYPQTLLLDVRPWYLNRKQIESKLYQDIELKEGQWFVSEDSAIYKATQDMLGGFGVSICLGAVILLSMFLLVYNVWCIQNNKDIRQYGMMEVLGVGYQDIKKILRKQSFRIWVKGSIAGGGAAAGLVFLILPTLLRKMYLGDTGEIGNLQVFYPQLLLSVIGFTGLIFFLATMLALRKLRNLNPLEALRYEEVDHFEIIKEYRGTRTKKRTFLKELAKRNVLRSKKKFIMTVFSLVLGCEVALCTSVITNGMDITHQLEANPDFIVTISSEACKMAPQLGNAGILNDSMFTKQAESELIQIAGEYAENTKQTYGNLSVFDGLEQCIYNVLNASVRKNSVIIEAVSEEKLNELAEYMKKENLSVDETVLENGNGFIVAHPHLASNQDQYTNSKIGTKVEAYKLVSEGEQIEENSKVELTNCGYIDLTEKGIPDLNIVWEDDEIIYFLVNEHTLESLSEIMPKQLFQIAFDYDKGKEPQVKRELKQWIEEKNTEFQNRIGMEVDLFQLVCNSDIIAQKRNYIEGSRMVMFFISVMLLFVGLMNYFSTIVTGIFMRKKELAIMESLGMTRRQLRKMLTLEGFYYLKMVMLFLMTIGNLLLFLIEGIMKKQVDYFQYSYPILELLIIVAVLSMVCGMVPRIVYRKTAGKSTVQRLRDAMLAP